MNEELTQLIKQQYQVEFKDTSLSLDQLLLIHSYVN